ncbi:aromatic ring-hydroxylating oxygenase subunit alpha [Rhodococcus sp. NPDC055024]
MTIDFAAMVDIDEGLIDRRIFADSDVFDAEMERIFRKSWLLLGHESEISEPNDFITTWMGADPVIVTRTADGAIHAMLNMCRHRGGAVCRTDRGTAQAFTCPYHAWTYKNDGSLARVPALDVGYHDRLDLTQWGLVSVARIDTYKGLIFATWNEDSEPLDEFLGDMRWYLDCILDRVDGGTELVVGSRRWVIPCNWKHAAENFVGDAYHGAPTHGSVMGLDGFGFHPELDNSEGYQVSPADGHGVGIWFAPDHQAVPGYGQLPGVDDYLRERSDEIRSRLGEMRADRVCPVHGHVFPNFSIEFNFSSLHIWHPRGPGLTEVRDLTLVDRNAPPEVKDLVRDHCMRRQGPAGTWEQDDMDNWTEVTRSSTQPTARRVLANYQMGNGFEHRDDRFPGVVDHKHSDLNQRAFYRRWRDLMTAPDATGEPVRDAQQSHTASGNGAHGVERLVPGGDDLVEAER